MKSVKDNFKFKDQRPKIKAALALIFGLWSLNFAFAQSFPEKPNPPRLVNDFANVFSRSEAQELESKLVRYDDSTSTQISIVTVETLDGMEVAQYATELGEKWGIGSKDKDNGVLILVASADRKVFIATGRGVEEYLPDIVCKRIVERKIVPYFKQNDYSGGINAAVDEMYERLRGTFVNTDKGKIDGIPIWVIILIIIIVIFILPRFLGGGGGTYSRRGYSRGFGSGPVIWGGGGGGFGGGGGGGFGGFGGGSFGGGGAGGSW